MQAAPVPAHQADNRITPAMAAGVSAIEEAASEMDEMAMRELPDKKRLALRCYGEMEAVRKVA